LDFTSKFPRHYYPTVPRYDKPTNNPIKSVYNRARVEQIPIREKLIKKSAPFFELSDIEEKDEENFLTWYKTTNNIDYFQDLKDYITDVPSSTMGGKYKKFKKRKKSKKTKKKKI